jgi:hypothetical protein
LEDIKRRVMKVVSYYNVVPGKNKSQEKFDILTNFIQGVNAVGDTGILHKGNDIVNCDVGVIQGWQHERGKNAPHLRLRQNVIDTQINSNKYVISGDANLFLYANKSNAPFHYLRYSFNGIFPTTGIYCDNNPDPKRWEQISNDTGIVLEDYKTKGKNVVVCMQRQGGWSMGPISIFDWTKNVVTEIKKYTDRKIILRPHPGDKKAITTYLPQLHQYFKQDPNIKISNLTTPLSEDLAKAWAVVNHNSSSIVGPIIQGHHAFITDPLKSQCAEVADTDFSKIENPNHFNRQAWLERISMFHWKFSELQDGTCWRHMRNYCFQ